MYATTTKPLTFTEFLLWDDGSGRDFELVDGIPRPLSEPNANHEDLIQRLCTYLEAHSQTTGQPYVCRQSKQIRLTTTGPTFMILFTIMDKTIFDDFYGLATGTM